MLKVTPAKEREAKYARLNPREIKPFTRKTAESEGNSSVKMK